MEKKRRDQNEHNKKLKKKLSYNSKDRRMEFVIPEHFSLVQNPDETARFFDVLLSYIVDKKNFGRRRRIYFDAKKVSKLTVDALMYLLAIINNLGSMFEGHYRFGGNEPRDELSRRKFRESGFYKYVKLEGGHIINKNTENTQIISGEKYDGNLASAMSDFVCSIAKTKTSKCSFLYDMLIEVMTNTQHHAYTKHKERDQVFNKNWYCYGDYNKEKGIIAFSFIDTGYGIPSTIQKRLREKIVDYFSEEYEHQYVISALRGENRTATKLENRGKGLQQIYKYCKENKVTNLHIITNKADVTVNGEELEGKQILFSLRGTLYYWEINLSSLR